MGLLVGAHKPGGRTWLNTLRRDLQSARWPAHQRRFGRSAAYLEDHGPSWVVISGVISRVTIVIIQIRGLLTPLITTHEPPSRV